MLTTVFIINKYKVSLQYHVFFLISLAGMFMDFMDVMDVLFWPNLPKYFCLHFV